MLSCPLPEGLVRRAILSRLLQCEQRWTETTVKADTSKIFLAFHNLEKRQPTQMFSLFFPDFPRIAPFSLKKKKGKNILIKIMPLFFRHSRTTVIHIKNIYLHGIPLILENMTELTVYIASACIVYMWNYKLENGCTKYTKLIKGQKVCYFPI